MKRAVMVFCALVVIFVGLLSNQFEHYQAGTDVSSDIDDHENEYYEDEYEDAEESNMYSSKTKTAEDVEMIDVDTQPDSITVLVNREYPMDKDYIPADLVVPSIRFSYYGTYEKSYVRQVTAAALEKLFAKAEENQIILKGVSGFRSYSRQQQIYNNNVNARGKTTTNLVSAKPGTSEHQTGLAMDVSSESVGCALETSFGNTAEGKWLAENCHKFGFIIRYPEDKTDITGYSYEPWHIRYVGKKLATYLYKKELTLEEYYQTTAKADKIVEPQSDVMDDDMENEPEVTSAPTPKPTQRSASTVQPTARPTARPAATTVPKVENKPKATKKPKVTKKPQETQKPSTQQPEDPEVSETTPGTEPAPEEVPSSDQTPASNDTGVDTTVEDASME